MMSSCFITRTDIGNFREIKKQPGTDVYTYSKTKQCYLFWGLIPLGKSRAAVPSDGNCQVTSRYNLLDAAISSITGGFFGMQTVKVRAVRYTGDNSNAGGNQGGQNINVTIQQVNVEQKADSQNLPQASQNKQQEQTQEQTQKPTNVAQPKEVENNNQQPQEAEKQTFGEKFKNLFKKNENKKSE